MPKKTKKDETVFSELFSENNLIEDKKPKGIKKQAPSETITKNLETITKNDQPKILSTSEYEELAKILNHEEVPSTVKDLTITRSEVHPQSYNILKNDKIVGRLTGPYLIGGYVFRTWSVRHGKELKDIFLTLDEALALVKKIKF